MKSDLTGPVGCFVVAAVVAVVMGLMWFLVWCAMGTGAR